MNKLSFLTFKLRYLNINLIDKINFNKNNLNLLKTTKNYFNQKSSDKTNEKENINNPNLENSNINLKNLKEEIKKNLIDFINEEKDASPQEKYKEYSTEYFKAKEAFTRSEIYSMKKKLEKAGKSDPDWQLNLNRKFIQRNFLNKENIFYDFEKDKTEEKIINYEFVKNLNLNEPLMIYETYYKSYRNLNKIKRKFMIYCFITSVAYYKFFFNYNFLFAHNFTAYLVTNTAFIMLVIYWNLIKFYNKTIVLSAKYDNLDDSVIFQTHRYFLKGGATHKIKVSDIECFKKKVFTLGDYIFVRSKSDKKLLFMLFPEAIWHEKEVFENIFNISVDLKEDKKENKDDGKKNEDKI